MSTVENDPVQLDNDATKDDIEHGEYYIGEVNNVEEYGVFINVTPKDATDVNGLVHKTNIPFHRSPSDYTVGERVVVTLRERRGDDELSFAIVSDEVDRSADTDHMDMAQSQVNSVYENQESSDSVPLPSFVSHCGNHSARTIEQLISNGYEVRSFGFNRDEEGLHLNLTFDEPE